MMFLWMVRNSALKTGINSGWKAALDLGTNTFQIAVADKTRQAKLRYTEKVGVKLGRGGMNKRQILPASVEAAVKTLVHFQQVLASFGLKPADCLTVGTSAFRNAENAPEVVGLIAQNTGFLVQIIDGEKEAELIFEGVKASGALQRHKHNLIMDIGGGSVEFILCKGLQPLWKKSFETGGLRLMEKAGFPDPLISEEQKKLSEYLRMEWKPLWAKLEGLYPIELIGCSGAFETFGTLHLASENKHSESQLPSAFRIPVRSFHAIKQKLYSCSLEKRLALIGMEPIRAEMIPYAALMIDLVLEYIPAQYFSASTFSLKEGILFGT